MTYQEPLTFGDVMAIAAMRRAEADAEARSVAIERRRAFHAEIAAIDGPKDGRNVVIDWSKYTALYIACRSQGWTIQQITDMISESEGVSLTADTVRRAMNKLGIVMSGRFGRAMS